MKPKLSKRGFTIIEVVIAIALISLAFLGITQALLKTTEYNIDVDITTNSILLARDAMATTMAKDFADIDDVSTTNFSAPFDDYSYQVNVDYVEPTNLDTPVAGPTDYKRIVTTITANGWTGNIMLYNVKVNL
jgi:prepilin-type N-terminal cleavage/methylation domain-containing protein